MRAAGFVIACLICLWPAWSTAMEPMNDAAMDSVHAQSGIAIGIDNVQMYNHSGWAYEATDGGTNKKIEFNDTASYLILNTRNPLTLRVKQNPAGVAMMEITGQPSIWLQMNTNNFAFAGQDLGSMHLNLRPPEGNLMGFMEEFTLHVAPLGTQTGFNTDGIAFQFENRTGIEEVRWDYNKDSADEFRLGGVYMAGTFDAFDPATDLGNPGNWNPTDRFVIGYLDPYGDGGTMGPATFQVIPDPADTLNEGYAMLRFNLPMEGSVRANEINMHIVDDQGPQPPPNWPDEPAVNDIEFVADDFGPMILDSMEFDHLQVDFKTLE